MTDQMTAPESKTPLSRVDSCYPTEDGHVHAILKDTWCQETSADDALDSIGDAMVDRGLALALESRVAELESKLNLIRIEAEERDKNNGDVSPAWILQTLEE